MNAPAQLSAVAVRRADLSNPDVVRRIDQFVAAHPDAQLFHRPQWSIAVERGCGQRNHYLVAVRPDGSLAGLLPLTEVRSRLFGNALVSTGFGTGGGIIAEDDAVAAVLADAAVAVADRGGWATVELRSGRLPDGWQVQEGVYANFAKPLPRGEAAILKSIKRRHRAVRRARAFDLEVRCGNCARDRDEHFACYSASVRNLGSPVYPRALFDAMLDLFGEDADILTILRDGRPQASVLNFYFKDTVFAYWGGGTAEARDCFANELMYFELMCYASERGCTRFDFGRSKVGSGSYAFKTLWDFEPEPLRYAVRTADGGPPRDINPASPQYRLQVAAWQKLPLCIANRIGPVIARGLG